MEKQLAQSGVLVQRIALVLIALVLAIGAGILGVYTFRVSDPYIQDVLSLNGNALRGQAIFQINCAGCHGSQGDGRVGPSLQHISKRKSEVGVIHQVISGKTPPMPKFQPSPQEMADLLSYLEEL